MQAMRKKINGLETFQIFEYKMRQSAACDRRPLFGHNPKRSKKYSSSKQIKHSWKSSTEKKEERKILKGIVAQVLSGVD